MTTSKTDHSARDAWILMLAAAAILMITMGSRVTTGLFVSPLNTATGLGVVKISLAMAIGQLVWGASQPIFGAIADKYGTVRVVIAGCLMLALGTAITPFVTSEWGLVLTLGILTACGAGAGSFGILIGGVAYRLPPERRAFAGGFINAGSSLGQVVFAPLVQAIINAAGWVAAMMTLAGTTLLAIPLSFLLGRPVAKSGAAPAGVAGNASSRQRRWVWASRSRSRYAIELPLSARRILHVRLSYRVPGDAPSGRSGALRPAGKRFGSNARRDRPVQHRWQPGRRNPGVALPDEASASLDVREPRRDHHYLPDGAQNRDDVLCVRGRARLHLAGDSAADGRAGGQAVRDALPGDAVRTDAPLAPDRRLFRRPGWAASPSPATATTRGCGTPTSGSRSRPRC